MKLQPTRAELAATSPKDPSEPILVSHQWWHRGSQCSPEDLKLLKLLFKII